MGYELEAFLGNETVRARLHPGYSFAKIVQLQQGILLLPLTDAFFAELKREQVPSAPNPFPRFEKLSAASVALAEELSAGTTVAYIEAGYFGGNGSQEAIVWQNRQIILGPIYTDDSINQALRLLGVQRVGRDDEFDSVGLGRQRKTEKW